MVLFKYTNQGVIKDMEEKSFGKKFLIIVLTIITFFVVLFALEFISKPVHILYIKIKSNIVVAQIKSNFTDAEKEQVDWNYLKNDIYLLESGIGISSDREIHQESTNISGDKSNSPRIDFDAITISPNKYTSGKGYEVTQSLVNDNTSTMSISVLGRHVYSKTSYYGISRLLPKFALLLSAILIFISLIKVSITYFIKNERNKSAIVRLIIYCILYISAQVMAINLYNNVLTFYRLGID